MQLSFVRHMRERYNGDLERLNRDFGLNYWSNRINSWEEFPSVVGTINGSLGCAFEAFQRQQVTDFLLRQSEIVREYCRPISSSPITLIFPGRATPSACSRTWIIFRRPGRSPSRAATSTILPRIS